MDTHHKKWLVSRPKLLRMKCIYLQFLAFVQYKHLQFVLWSIMDINSDLLSISGCHSFYRTLGTHKWLVNNFTLRHKILSNWSSDIILLRWPDNKWIIQVYYSMHYRQFYQILVDSQWPQIWSHHTELESWFCDILCICLRCHKHFLT